MNTSFEQKKADRLIFFSHILSDIDSFFLNIKSVNGFKLDQSLIQIRENASEVINDQYWSLTETIVRPIIKKNDLDIEANIDIYKILSCIEYAIMLTMPVIYNDNDLSDKDRLILTQELNGKLAFYIAVKYMSGWDGFTEYFVPHIFDEVLQYQEKSRINNCLSIKDEHIKVLSFSTGVSNIPIFTNATWWRSLAYNIYLKSEIARLIK